MIKKITKRIFNDIIKPRNISEWILRIFGLLVIALGLSGVEVGIRSQGAPVILMGTILLLIECNRDTDWFKKLKRSLKDS